VTVITDPRVRRTAGTGRCAHCDGFGQQIGHTCVYCAGTGHATCNCPPDQRKRGV
jgi:hypothetical protein